MDRFLGFALIGLLVSLVALFIWKKVERRLAYRKLRARGGDLDRLVESFGVVRRANESDAELRDRAKRMLGIMFRENESDR